MPSILLEFVIFGANTSMAISFQNVVIRCEAIIQNTIGVVIKNINPASKLPTEVERR